MMLTLCQNQKLTIHNLRNVGYTSWYVTLKSDQFTTVLPSCTGPTREHHKTYQNYQQRHELH